MQLLLNWVGFLGFVWMAVFVLFNQFRFLLSLKGPTFQSIYNTSWFAYFYYIPIEFLLTFLVIFFLQIPFLLKLFTYFNSYLVDWCRSWAEIRLLINHVQLVFARRFFLCFLVIYRFKGFDCCSQFLYFLLVLPHYNLSVELFLEVFVGSVGQVYFIPVFVLKLFGLLFLEIIFDLYLQDIEMFFNCCFSKLLLFLILKKHEIILHSKSANLFFLQSPFKEYFIVIRLQIMVLFPLIRPGNYLRRPLLIRVYSPLLGRKIEFLHFSKWIDFWLDCSFSCS